jgi:uncharacterized repeat protein (TIGR01451 family)
MKRSFCQWVRLYRRSLSFLLLLPLVASAIVACEPNARQGDEKATTSLTLSREVGPIGAPVTITFTALVPTVEGRQTNTYWVEMILPPGMEWVTPLQVTLASGSETCTSTLIYSQFVRVGGKTLCQFTIQARARVAGRYMIQSSLKLFETLIPSGDAESSSATFTFYYAANGLIARKSFNPAQVNQNESSTMTISITNDSTVNVTGMAFEDPMPVGMELTAISGNSCGGNARIEGGRLIYSGGRLNANASCSIQATVRGAGAGNLLNTVSFINTDQFNFSNQAQASLNVVPPTATPLPPPPPPPPPQPPPPVEGTPPGE